MDNSTILLSCPRWGALEVCVEGVGVADVLQERSGKVRKGQESSGKVMKAVRPLIVQKGNGKCFGWPGVS